VSNPRDIVASLPGIKQRESKLCALCDQGVGHDTNIMFWRLRFERAGLLPQAIRRQHGLELLLGSPVLAQAMGPDENIAKIIDGPHEVWVCEPCVMDHLLGLFPIAERQNEKGA
jgi:hypothetical protein